jgi:hypothetical protein
MRARAPRASRSGICSSNALARVHRREISPIQIYNRIERMTDKEQKLLVALVLMVNQHLDEHMDEVDTRAVWAGEHAIEALADFGLMELVNTRFGRWTKAGKQFRREVAGIRDRERIDHPGEIRLVGKSEPESRS